MSTKNRYKARIAGTAIEAAREHTAKSLPQPALPSPDKVRSMAVVSEHPKVAVTNFAEHLYDSVTRSDHLRTHHLRVLLERQRQRLELDYERALDNLSELSRTVIKYTQFAAMPTREKVQLVILVVALLSLIGASVATIKTVALDSGIVASAPQAIAFGLVPAAGALALASLVCGLRTPKAFRRGKTIVNVATLILLVPWTVLLVLVFAGGSTVNTDILIAKLSAGEPLPVGSSAGPVLERFFFLIAVFFEIVGGGYFKIAIQQLLNRSERAVSERCGIYTEGESELEFISSELSELEVADASLEFREETIKSGRPAFVDRVLALLLEPPTPPAAPSPAPHDAPTLRKGFELITPDNGRYAS